MDVEGVLRRQAGVISRTQAMAVGLTGAQVDRRVTTGRWEVLHPGVYLAAEHEYTVEARVRSAALYAGERATVTGVAAAWWHGLWPYPPDTVEITIPTRRRVRPAPMIRIRRRDLDWRDRVETRHLWVTEPALTALEAAVALGKRGPELLDRALQRRVRFQTVYRAHCRNLGSRGSGTAGTLLAAAADRAASQAERLIIKLLRNAGIGGWERGYWISGYEVDLAFPELRIAVEVDGWAWHVDVERFGRDRRKQNALEVAGWTVLRFTWHDLTQRPEAVIAEIRAVMARRQAHDR
jgi:very-short-patch-repair endonuclease